ncbi:MAG: hypothetical protein KF752_11710 [Pirellulaceae bacterium]|nr:hypothetical protein [Pirellulaceae bacterium]
MNFKKITTLLAQGPPAETHDNSFMNWVLGGIAAIVLALSSVIAGLYRVQVKTYEDRIKDLEGEVVSLRGNAVTLTENVSQCHREHETTRIQLARMEERLKALENCSKS